MPATRTLKTFTVLPHLPPRLGALHKIAYNLWWSWTQDAIELFRRIEIDHFRELDHSPVRLLNSISQQRLEELVGDDGFLAHLDRVEQSLDRYMTARTWFQDTYDEKVRNLHVA